MSMIQINLLPPEMRRTSGGLRVTKAAVLGLVVVVGFVGALAALTVMQAARLSIVQGDIAQAQAKVEDLRDDIMLVDRLEDVKTKILRRMDAIETLEQNRGNWVRNVEDLLAVIPDYLWLSGFHKDELKKSRTRASTPDTVAVPDNKYLLDGFCFTISSLANLILNMQDSPRFTNVALKHAALKELKKRNVYEFQVACTLEEIDDDAAGFGDEPKRPTRMGATTEDIDGALATSHDWDINAMNEATAP